MGLLKTLFWLVMLIILMPFAYAVAPVTYQQILIVLKQDYVIYGMATFVVAYYLFLKRRIKFFQTLDHELSHTIVSMCFGHRVTELRATAREGGHITHHGSRHNVLISLAPYVWRLPMIAVTFVIWLLNRDHLEWYYLAIWGFFFAYRTISIFEEARPRQTDLSKVGLIRAYVWIICLNVIWLGVLATAMQNNYGMQDFWHDIVPSLKALWAYLPEKLRIKF